MMIAYVNQFFKDFDYREQDAAHLLTCLQKIYANDQARAHFEQALAAYDADMNCDYGQIMGKARQAGSTVGVRSYTSELLLFICLSRKLRERYEEKGIDLSIWHDSMLDLRYKLDECLAVYGICGSFVAGWFPGFFNLTRFALGRLQFELWDLDRDYQKGDISLAKGTKTINMHIPRSGEPLNPSLRSNAPASPCPLCATPGCFFLSRQTSCTRNPTCASSYPNLTSLHGATATERTFGVYLTPWSSIPIVCPPTAACAVTTLRD